MQITDVLLCHDDLCHADVLIHPSGGGGRREDARQIYAIFVGSNVLETLLVVSEERLMPAFVQCQRNPCGGRVKETSHHLCYLQQLCSNETSTKHIGVIWGRGVGENQKSMRT